MAIDTFTDILRALEDHPEWREQMRALVLTRELLELPEQLAELRLETEQRFAQLTERIVQLTERVNQLAELLKELGFQVKRNGDAIGQLKGDLLELRLRERAPTWLASIVRRPRVLSADELDDLLEAAVGAGRLSDEETGRLRLLDAIVRGRRDGEQVLLAVEASHGVGPHDVERAAEGARVLRKTGAEAAPVVVGRWATPEARELADRLAVAFVPDPTAAKREAA